MSLTQRTCHLVFGAILLAISALMPVKAHAQDGIESTSTSLKIVATPYLWLLGVDGTFSVAGISIPVAIKPFELIGSADSAVGFQGRFSVTSERWGALADVTYGSMDLGLVPLPPVTIFGITVPVSATTLAGDVVLLEMMGSAALFEANQGLADFEGLSWNVRALAGFRYASLSLDGGLALGPVANVSDSWFDPLFGMLWFASSDSGWRGELLTLIGGFGAGTDLTWTLEGGARYAFAMQSVDLSVWGGYRALSLDRTASDLLPGTTFEMLAHGPLVGIGVEF